jgi:hypothetical protein
VRLAVKVLDAQHLDHAVEGVRVKEHPAQHRLFGVETLGRDLAEGIFETGHGGF